MVVTTGTCSGGGGREGKRERGGVESEERWRERERQRETETERERERRKESEEGT